MNRTPLDSKLLKSIGYEGDILEVEFQSGKTYRYSKVTQADYDALMGAKSVGSHFLKTIKPGFACTPVEQEQQ